MKEQIISIGGGGFSNWGKYSDKDRDISHYFLKQTGKENPSICFIPTASADNAQYIVNFYAEFTALPCRPSHLSLFAPSSSDLETFLLEKDAIYVGGGSTKNLLALWKEWKLDKILKKALEKGVVLGGISAGMNCWYEESITDSLFGELTALPGLGFLKGSACPHYDTEENRRPCYHKLIKTKKIKPGIAIEDHVAVHYINGKVHNIVTTNKKSAYEVKCQKEKVIETKLKITKKL